MRTSKVFGVLATVLQLSGCDFLGGVVRTYSVKGPVDFTCVENLLASSPKVTEFEYESRDGAIPLTWRGLEEPNKVHEYSYQLDGIERKARLIFVIDYKSDITYSNGLGCVNCVPPQKDIDSVRRFLDEFEAAVEVRCGIEGIALQAEEDCFRVQCDAA